MNANYENSHIDLMRSILTQLRETPLVLKGGTALMLCYDLDRFSEDLDFDAPKKLNLESKIKSSIPSNLDLVQVLVLKNTDTVTRYRVRYRAHDVERSLKIEVSYRTPVPLNQVNFINGIKVAALPRLLDQKLKASFDGDDPRTKSRDLYDIYFMARKYPEIFKDDLLSRFCNFAVSPDFLVSRYRDSYLEDSLVNSRISLEDLALGTCLAADELCKMPPD